ncbi:MAG: gamma-glutamyl-gamma-aminobutyrate hydrolase family protein [Saprospiraceae bacterium]|nr:gamma-glutamyl-gamma-aminobutyrate hydrolase family protein [Saprospiraceae bacterium]
MKIIKTFLFISLIIILNSCSNTAKQEETKEIKTLKIAISKAKGSEGYLNYVKWVNLLAPEAECIDMYFTSLDSAIMLFEECSGLIVSGGADVFPGRYGKIADTTRCGAIDFRRDTLEIKLIKEALRRKMPILGVCRGHQILNVALGGSLIIDIPTDFDTTVSHQCDDWQNCFHNVNLTKGSLLEEICKVNSGIVNTNHHQAVDVLASELKVSANSTDGLIEAVEWKNPEGKSFLIGVQWHPERMDTTNVLSWNIGKRFIEEAEKFSE